MVLVAAFAGVVLMHRRAARLAADHSRGTAKAFLLGASPDGPC